MPILTAESLPKSCDAAAPNGFSSFEWLVIAIGTRDESRPLQWSPFGRMLLSLLGGGPQPLASPCLETLRRTASVARHHGWNMPAAELGTFLRAGWTEQQLEHLIESVGPPEPFIAAWTPCEPGGGAASDERRSHDRTMMEIVQ